MTQRKRDSRERARQVIAAQRRAEARRKNMIKAGVAVAAVIVAVGILVGVKLSSGSSKTGPATVASQDLVAKVTGLPAATLNTIGKGKVSVLPKATTGQTTLTADGKPLVFYMGAEFCPFCAAERWPMIVALSRFGTFSNLSQAYSSSTDEFPHTPTFSFHGSTYTSNYLTFQPKEIEDGNQRPLETLTPAQQQLVTQFDPPASGQQGNPFPFVTLANQAIVSGASYDPSLLAGKTPAQVAAALQDPSSPIAQAIGGSANALTAQLCKLTNNQPGNVCSSPAVTAFNGTSGG